MPDPQDDSTQQQDPTNPIEAELKEMTKIAQHALADLQNFRRRAEEERASYITYANADLLNALLPSIENMNKALAHEPKDAEWIKGAETTMKQLLQTLEQKGLKAIPTAAGEKFDPNFHEALMVAPGTKDEILEEFEKGYMLGEKVLKRSRVQVGNSE